MVNEAQSIRSDICRCAMDETELRDTSSVTRWRSIFNLEALRTRCQLTILSTIFLTHKTVRRVWHACFDHSTRLKMNAAFLQPPGVHPSKFLE
jgi:hypothetical protein